MFQKFFKNKKKMFCLYRETIERVNVKFNEDGTINYQEHRDYKFLPELSKGRQSDKLNVPNLPLLGAAAMSKYSFMLTRFSMSTLFRTLNAQPFINLPAHRFMWGYDDNLYELAKGVLALRNESPLDKFGIMANVCMLLVVAMDTNCHFPRQSAILFTVTMVTTNQLSLINNTKCHS